jgi:hypothetical protein
MYLYPDGSISTTEPHDGQVYYVTMGGVQRSFEWDEFLGTWVDITPTSTSRVATYIAKNVKFFLNGTPLEMGGDFSISGTESVNCNHEWIPYEGFTQRYNYCKKCDIKDNA